MAPARHYSELIVWQLAEEIRIEVFKLTPKPGFATDFKAKDQAEDSINSTCRNIAEGFGCETHAEFARFLEISRRSLNELHDVLHGALLKKYVSASELAPIRQLSRRIYPAFGRFILTSNALPTIDLKEAGRRARLRDAPQRVKTAPASVGAIALSSAREIAPTSVRWIAPTCEGGIAPTIDSAIDRQGSGSHRPAKKESHRPASARSHRPASDESHRPASARSHRQGSGSHR